MLAVLRRRPLTFLTIFGSIAWSSDAKRRERTIIATRGFSRFASACYACGRVALDYRINVHPIENADGEGSVTGVAARRACDKRSAERLLQFARSHGGVYAKLTQYISTLNHVLPSEWTGTLSVMLNDAKPSPWQDVASVFESDFGMPATTVFKSIEETPIAAASIAQVHRAVLRDTGELVAVKIQYPNLRARAFSDMATMRFLASAYGAYSPGHDYEWLFPEFTAALNAELNFLQEARNSVRAAAMLAHDSRFAVPRVYPALCSERVLTMEWIDGVTLRDATTGPNAKGIRAASGGADSQWVAKAVLDAFSELTFVHGFVHSDPHAANLMLRITKNGLPQLVIIDWGMVRRLAPDFRRGYSELWCALLSQDKTAGLAATLKLGLSDTEYNALSLMLTYRPANTSTALGARIDSSERAKVREQYKDVTAGDINEFMQRLPRDFLFCGRNAQIVRSLNLDLGGVSADRFRANGRAAIRGMALTAAMGGGGGGKDHSNSPIVPRGGSANVVSDFELQPAVKERGLLPLAASALRAATGRVHEVPRVPLTYLTALRTVSFHETPTESEDLAAKRGAVLTTWESAVAGANISALFWRLWVAETILALASYWSGHAEIVDEEAAVANKKTKNHIERGQMG
jgi:aarF domain-containing kinase